MITTFETIKSHRPCGLEPGCDSGFDKLTTTLKRSTGGVSLLEILDSNGVNDAYWALRCWPRKKYAELRADVAETVFPNWHRKFPDDLSVRKCIDGWRKLGRGEISDDEFEKLRDNASSYAFSYAFSAAATYAASAAAASAAAAAYSCASSAADAAAASAAAAAASAASYAVYFSESAAASAAVSASAAAAESACAAVSVAESDARGEQWEINEKLMRVFLENKQGEIK